MDVDVCELETSYESASWDSYVKHHKYSTVYHLSGWKNVIERTYRHKTFYLFAYQQKVLDAGFKEQKRNIVGVLPLVYLKHFIFGYKLISIPFFDTGGILADDEEVEKALIRNAVIIAENLKASTLELRHIFPMSWIEKENNNSKCTGNNTSIQTHKVRMILDLPDSSEILMKSFKSKLRSQIKKPLREGLTTKIGGVELLDSFYNVFAENMRDLGSPVHSKKIIKKTLVEFSETTRIILVLKNEEAVACSIVTGFNETLANPWASSLRRFSRYSPNMLLYWTMLEYGCDNGYSSFDFGRSTPGEGTYKFKKQWGARPQSLFWHYISFEGNEAQDASSEKSKFDKMIALWKKLPVTLTKFVGPRLRKHIGL